MVIHKSSGFVDALKNAGSFAINPILKIEDDSLLGGGRVGHILERTLEEMSSPVSLLSMALAPVTGGASVGFRSAMLGGQAAKIAAARGIGSKLAQSVALEGAASAGAVGAPKLVEAAGIDNQYAQMAAGLVAGFGAPAVLGRSTAVKSAASKAADVPGATKRNIDEALNKEALFRADPTAANRADSVDFEVVGPYGGVGRVKIGSQFRSADFQMLKPRPGKNPVDLLSRLPEKSELIIEPRRVRELEDNLPAQQVWAQFAPNQGHKPGPNNWPISSMAGAGGGPSMPGHDPSDNLGNWWGSSQKPKRDLEDLENTFRREDMGVASVVESAEAKITVDAWRTTYRAGEPMRDALRKASGSDEIVLYRGQPNVQGTPMVPRKQIDLAMAELRAEIKSQNPHTEMLLSPQEIDIMAAEEYWQLTDGATQFSMGPRPLPPQIVEGYSPLPEKAAAFSSGGSYPMDSYLDTVLLVRRVKIDDIVGTLGRAPNGTSEFVVLNPLALSSETMKAITGRVTRRSLRRSRVEEVWKQKVAGLRDVPDIPERSTRGELYRNKLRENVIIPFTKGSVRAWRAAGTTTSYKEFLDEMRNPSPAPVKRIDDW